MPIVTRSQGNKQKESKLESSVGCKLSNPFDEYANMEETEITEELLQECQENATFQKLMERLIEADKEKYLLMLTSKGVNIPEDFDTKNLRNIDERISRTRSRNYAYQEQQEKKRYMTQKTHANKTTPMNKTMPTIRTILMKEGKLSLDGEMHPWFLLHNKSKCCKDKCRTCNKELQCDIPWMKFVLILFIGD